MFRQIKTSNVAPFSDLELNFGTRLNLLTGDNGLGKTYLLDLIYYILSSDLNNRTAWMTSSLASPKIQAKYFVAHCQQETSYEYRPDIQQWTIPQIHFNQDKKLSRHTGPVIYIRSNESFGVYDSARNLPATSNVKNSLSNMRADQLWNGFSSDTDGTPICNGLIRDWVSWQRGIPELFDQLTQCLATLSDHVEPLCPGQPIRTSTVDARDTPTLIMPYGLVPVTKASAGMRRVLSMAYLVVWSWNEHLENCKLRQTEPSRHICVLLDEAECHLHPRWQRLVLPSLLKAIEGLTKNEVEVQIVVSSHSPLVTASLEPDFNLKTDRLFHCAMEIPETPDETKKPAVRIDSLDWQPNGQADSWLVSEVFNLEQPRSFQAEKAMHNALELLRKPKASKKEIKAVNQALLLARLPDDEPFWVRWQAFVESQS